MRLPTIVSFAVLMIAPASGIGEAAPQDIAAPQPRVTSSPHRMCGDDVIASGTARIMPGFGSGALVIATAKPRAQAFFDNGLQLSHAFAHAAGTAAFSEAARIDPQCAMCRWGVAWSQGPTINYPIDAATQVKLGKLVDSAIPLAATGPLLDRQMLAALALRYRIGRPGAADIAFARAMDGIARDHPDSDEILTLAADAWMIPAALADDKQGLPRAVALLETVLKRTPDFTPAIHFYIHATEMSGFPGRAERYADRLGALAPAASHLIHMPSHTYYWVGRYQDAAVANVRAVAVGQADARAAKVPEPDGAFTQPYHAHNVHFGVGSALLAGDAQSALALSGPVLRRLARRSDAEPFGQMVGGMAYAAVGRFAEPVAVLGLPEPLEPMGYLRAYRHYARGEAYARMGDARAVRTEAAAIPKAAGPIGGADASRQARNLMRIAKAVLNGRAAMIEQRYDLAIRAYADAARFDEDPSMAAFSDPPIWWYSPRRSLAAALLAAGKAQDALREVETALRQRPRDPVTLSIRADVLRALGQTAASERDRAAADATWHGDRSAFGPRLS
ncbi:hypothetical protein [Sphingomonas sp. CARO-RG-8B-R24-01]|uniref:hypothetical protein n=1 Tax=Sphingomonas sp. CARO-RG-8B-R24-01 TaxID=2914831 RepID=UPI001F58B532|nr:hypothetical protein [Sphingomonas sp. CARO-RG-8B-R24-01]